MPGIRGEPGGNSFLIGAQWGGGSEAGFPPAQSLPQAVSHLLGRPKASLQSRQGWPSSTPEPKDREGEEEGRGGKWNKRGQGLY